MADFTNNLTAFANIILELSKQNYVPKCSKPFIDNLCTLAADLSKYVTMLETQVNDLGKKLEEVNGCLAIQKSVTDRLAEDRDKLEIR